MGGEKNILCTAGLESQAKNIVHFHHCHFTTEKLRVLYNYCCQTTALRSGALLPFFLKGGELTN